MIISDPLRLALSSLAFALAFAAGAQRRLSPWPLLEWLLVFERMRPLRNLRLGRRQHRIANPYQLKHLNEIEPRDH